MSNDSESTPLSPRTATLHAMMTTQLQTLRREMEQMRVEYDRRLRYRANDYSSDEEEGGRRRARREARRERRHEEAPQHLSVDKLGDVRHRNLCHCHEFSLPLFLHMWADLKNLARFNCAPNVAWFINVSLGRVVALPSFLGRKIWDFLHHSEPQLDSGTVHFLVIGRTRILSFGSRKELSEIFFPFGRYKSGTINILILEDSKDSSNVQFLLDARQWDPPSNTNKSIRSLFKNKILLERDNSSFGTTSHPESDEIG
ncbi:hypothetical protein Lal_00015709 [Lupinus albus]|nr:hypothetical protein Lal_00015709 [Lupinus albus]